uniref:Uncharacterized protein n=1 Tax=Arundo donax TaxID=35708 RepID=A0A0A9GEW4_ARUDO
MTQPPLTISSCPSRTSLANDSCFFRGASRHHLSRYDISSHMNFLRESLESDSTMVSRMCRDWRS